MSMPQAYVPANRVLVEILRSGYESVRADLDYIDVLFAGLSDELRTSLRTWVQDNEMATCLGYPMEDAKFPCWRVVMLTDMDQDRFVGNFLGDEDGLGNQPSPDDPFRDFIGYRARQAYRILTYTSNADITDAMYHLVKFLLLINDQLLDRCGFQERSYKGGDLPKDTSLQPNLMYTRALEVSGVAFFEHIVSYSEVADLQVSYDTFTA